MDSTAEALIRLHKAAVGAGSWDEALAAVTKATGAGRGQLIGVGPKHIRFNRVPEFDAAAVEEFTRIDGLNPAYNFRAASDAGARVHQILHEEHYANASRLIREDVYKDYCVRHDIPHGCHTLLSKDEDGFVIFATLRSRADGVSTPQQRRVLAQLAPSITDAVALDSALSGHGRALMLGSLDATGQAVAILNADGICLAVTDKCDRVLSTQSVLQLRNGTLQCVDEQDQQRLSHAFGQVLREGRRQAQVLIRRRYGPPLLAHIHRFCPPNSMLGFQPAALVHLLESGDKSAALTPWLHSMGLTASEVAIALNLKDGLPREHIAQARGTSLSTVRQQIKTIYHKLNVRRESELIALLNTPALFHSEN